MNRQKYFLPVLLLFLITLFAFNDAQAKDNFNLTAEELITAMESDSDLIILDVRTPPELVDQHGGSFYIESNPGIGTKAFLCTPLKIKTI